MYAFRLQPGVMVECILKKPASDIFKDFLRRNLVDYKQIDTNVVRMSIFEFIYIFGRYVESDNRFGDLFSQVMVIYE